MQNNNTVTKANKLAGWIEDFISNFSKVEASDDCEIKTAEINLNDLEKVVWNDETFYVSFDENGASIVNGFGNTVTTLKDIHTLEEVDKKLNGKQIVSEQDSELEINAEMQQEIGKALAYLNENEEVNIVDDERQVLGDEELVANEEVVSEEAIEDATEEITASNKSFIIESQAYEIAELVANEKIADATHVINNIVNEQVEKAVSNALAQLYARLDTIESYAIAGIEEGELAKSQQAEQETLQQISQENSIDRTTPQGKYKVNDSVVTDSVIDEPIEDNITLEKEDVIEEDSDEIVELPEEEVEAFKTASCPFCAGQLVKSAMTKSHVDIKCKGCDLEYQVDSNSGKIYIK